MKSILQATSKRADQLVIGDKILVHFKHRHGYLKIKGITNGNGMIRVHLSNIDYTYPEDDEVLVFSKKSKYVLKI